MTDLAEALDPDILHTAQSAQAALDLLRHHYADLLLRHDALLQKYDRLERTTHWALDVLAILEKKNETAVNL